MPVQDFTLRIVLIVGTLIVIAFLGALFSVSHNLQLFSKQKVQEHYVACSPAKYTKKIPGCQAKKKCPMSFECTLNEHNQRKCRWNRGRSNCNYSYDRCGVPGVSS